MVRGLFVLTSSDHRRAGLSETFFDENNISLCGRVHERCADAVVVVVAPLRFLPIISSSLLQGFAERRVFLAVEPVGPEVTDATVIVVAARGRDVSPVTEAITWIGEHDTYQFAEQIAPDARSRVHVFADKQREGWHALAAHYGKHLLDAYITDDIFEQFLQFGHEQLSRPDKPLVREALREQLGSRPPHGCLSSCQPEPPV